MGKVAIRRTVSRMGYRYRKQRGGFLAIVVTLFLLVGMWTWYTKVFSPMVQGLCEARANRIGQETIHRSIRNFLGGKNSLGAIFLRWKNQRRESPLWYLLILR